MAFWGIEVKPGKSFTHCCEKSKGRLRISQATLGIGDATQKGVVQCNVGNRRPVLLCALLPNKTESCHLDLEFEEADDVIFSVIGPQSVYLTGYYLQKNHQSNHESDTSMCDDVKVPLRPNRIFQTFDHRKSYGVDIENTQTEGSSFCSDDDKYDDSFIDDVELQVSPSDPVLSLEVDANALKKDTPNDRKRHCKQLRKRNREILSDGDETHKTEDEHDYLLSVLKSRRSLQTAVSDGAENIAQVLVELGKKAEDSGNCGSKANEKVDSDISGKSEREAMMGLDDKEWVKIEKNEGPNKVQTHEKIVDNYEKYLADEKVDESKGEVAIINQCLPMSNEKDCSQLLDFHNTKPKRKRRKHSLQEEKNREFEIDSGQSVLRVKKVQEVESSINLTDIDSNFRVPSLELGTENGQESKERTEELQLKETGAEEIGGICDNTPKDNESDHGLLCDGSTSKILLTANGEHQEQVMDNQPKKKIKKKGKKKAQGDGGVDMNATKMKSNQENMVMKYEDQTENVKQVKKTALLNGLIIEELAQGPPDGKLAAVGKKIKVFYTAMLESGKVFDSNMNGTACSCRLGDEEFIDGWNIGIDGMRIGDKRRLVIPPSMGFGSQGVGEKVPPNSWLVYDIELVNVR